MQSDALDATNVWLLSCQAEALSVMIHLQHVNSMADQVAWFCQCTAIQLETCLTAEVHFGVVCNKV
jgi:hypothetical protein